MQFDWNYLFSLVSFRDFWTASLLVAWLSILTWTIGVVTGFFVALARTSGPLWLRQVAGTYIWFFRSLPLLVLLIFVYNLPQIIPGLRPVLSNPFWAGLIALVVSETAYIAEIHRGGLLSIDKGQDEAAHALGIRSLGKYRNIIIPQTFRVALPTLGNQFITIVKLTSLVSVISLAEILLVGQRLYTRNFLVIETLVAVSLYYVLIVTIFTWALGWIERRMDVTRRSPGEIEVSDSNKRSSPSKTERCIGEDTVIEMDSISKTFGEKTVLNGISLKVRSGEVVSVIGPSGSGKTTLIRTINALQDIDAGSISFHGDDWINTKNGYKLAKSFHQDVVHLGMVFQSFNLFPHKTVLENIMMAPSYHGMGTMVELSRRAIDTLAKVGMVAHAKKYPHQLSGGQKQRVAIARALAMEPKVMLFDEPTSALDPELVGEVLQTIELLASDGMTMVIVTHEMRFATRISDRIVMMEDGRMVANLTKNELAKAEPESRIKQFMEQSETHG
ncbi:MAG: amino acid ABC transporter permease/ATP-binding protein [Rhizobiaceae bacterium]|nr:amino acid ABC transporter permease/ATP-binding protein [Rhizobiaceae bacterium]